MRFVVNATMGLSDIQYRRFFGWSFVSGWLWSTYTCVLAYEIGIALGAYPLASFVISGLVTSVVLAAVFLAVRRNHRAHQTPPVTGSEPT
jgi:membrane protein DedA with SNARE-associated domain